MKAVYINEFGDASKIIVGKLEKPRIKENQVLFKTIATTINKVDLFVRKGLYPINVDMPFLLGRDVVGVVEDANNSKFNKGDVVWSNSMGHETRNGVSASYLAIDEERLYLLPKGVDPYKAVSVLHPLTTAVLLLTDLITTKPNTNILIQGGAGLVGRKLVEVAKILKLNVYTTSIKNDFNYLENLGAICTDYNDPSYNVKFDILIDTSGQNNLGDNLKLLGENGKLLMITRPKDSSFDAWDFYTNGKQILGFVLSKQTIEQLDKASIFINKHFAKGHFLNDNIEILNYVKIKEYHELMENNKIIGKKPVFKF